MSRYCVDNNETNNFLGERTVVVSSINYTYFSNDLMIIYIYIHSVKSRYHLFSVLMKYTKQMIACEDQPLVASRRTHVARSRKQIHLFHPPLRGCYYKTLFTAMQYVVLISVHVTWEIYPTSDYEIMC